MGCDRISGDLQWDGLGKPRIYYAMFAIFCGLFLSVLDGTVCNVALPAMASQMDVSSADSIWIVNAFQLVVMMTLLPFSVLGELLGFRRVYCWGVAVFTIGSLLCAVSGGFASLIISRAVQGVGASMMMSINPSLVKLIYPKRLLGRGVAFNAVIVALASVAGPAIAAGILSVAGWPWLFAVNIPFGIAAFVAARKYLPDNPTRIEGRRFDFWEAILNAVVFGLFIGTFEAWSHGASMPVILAAGVLLAVSGTYYVRMQLHREYPMLPFDLLKIPVFSLSVVTSVLSFTAQMMCMVAIPFMLVETFGMDAARTGIFMTAWPVTVLFAAPVAGWLIGRVHPGILGAAGLAAMSAGCFLLAYIPQDASQVRLVLTLMLCGGGFAFFQSPNNHMLLSSAPSHRSGSAGGMQASARLVGQTLGAALVALMFNFSADNAPHDAMFLAGVLTLFGTVTSCSRSMLKR